MAAFEYLVCVPGGINECRVVQALDRCFERGCSRVKIDVRWAVRAQVLNDAT